MRCACVSDQMLTVSADRQEIAKEKRRNDELSSKLGEEKQDKEEVSEQFTK